ncbi:MAG: SLBB domain-containing protein, partial [Thermodesulfobacteriota bacterium]|nr:SLBB domain-containing protein [Thermodesulfobacteriota bacterium]
MRKSILLLIVILSLILAANPSFSRDVSPADVQKYLKTHPEAKKYVSPEGKPTPEGERLLKTRQREGAVTPAEVKEGLEKLKEKERGLEAVSPEETLPPEEVAPLEEVKEEAEILKPKISKAFPGDLPIFGQQLFSTGPASFTPPSNMPVSANYIIGPDDNIVVQLWGRINEQYTLTVQRDGSMQLPQIGAIQVAGLTYKQLQELIKREAESITGVNVNVTMGKLRSITIFVVGSVKKPGAYTVSAFDTILNALIYARGPDTLGSMRNIQLRRRSKIITTFDLYDLILKGDNSKDMRLEPGDIIFVPKAETVVTIGGDVKVPAVYELKKEKSLLNALKLAGGIKPSAYSEQIQIQRYLENRERIVLDMSLDGLKKEKKPFTLQDGDVVRIFPVIKEDTNAVYLFGNVTRPGKYEYSSGMRILDIIKAEDLNPETYFPYALIKRYNPPEMSAELVPFNLGEALLKHNIKENIRLQPGDEVHVFNKWIFEDKPYVSVAGEVRKPGKRPYEEGMYIKDAILAAGDLTKNAYFKKGEIIRVNEKREYQTIYFDVAKALENDPEENLLLQDQDRIVIHSIWEEKWKEVVSISGEVKKPQTAILTESMRISDLIFKAGGLTRNSYLEEAELYRTDWKTKKIFLQSFNLKKALDNDSHNNIELKDLDRLVIHSVWETIYKKNVSITGEVTKPGTYEYAENMTISDLIFKVGGLTRDSYLEEAELYRTDWRTKKVTLQSFNLKKALDNDSHNNIELKDLDRVVIHSVWEKIYKKEVSIVGEVTKPGTYGYAKNMTVKDLVFAAGNILESAYVDEAELTSLIVEDRQISKMERRIINLGKALEGDPAHNVRLRPHDRLHVNRIPDWHEAKYVSVSEEFKFPGRYVIKKGERLSSLIARAGGYTDHAYLRGAVFTRESVRALQQTSLDEMVKRMEREIMSQGAAQMATAVSKEEIEAKKVELEQKQKFIDSLYDLKATGRMTIRLAHARLLKG